MKTPEEAAAAGEWVKREVSRAALTNDAVDIRRNAEGHQAVIEATVLQKLRMVREQIRPLYPERAIILYEGGRVRRTFEAEWQRLWNSGSERYQEQLRVEYEARPDAPAALMEDYVLAGVAMLKGTLAVLEQQEFPGDDLYLLLHHTLNGLEYGASVDLISEMAKTPAQSLDATCAVFGLLIQAKRAASAGDLSQAYSFLIDAGHVLGLQRSAAYSMERLDDVVRKRHSKENAKRSHVKEAVLHDRARELFYELRPKEGWHSAAQASKAVWEAIEKETPEEAHPEKKRKLRISDSKVLEICQQLQRREKDGRGLDMRVEVVETAAGGAQSPSN